MLPSEWLWTDAQETGLRGEGKWVARILACPYVVLYLQNFALYVCSITVTEADYTTIVRGAPLP